MSIKLSRVFNVDSEDTISVIYKKYLNDLYAYAIGLGFFDELVKDAIQDVFYKLLTSQNKLSEIKNLKSYLFTALRHRLFDLRRKDRAFDSIDPEDISFSINVTILDEIVSIEEKKVLEKRISTLLDKLTSRQREAIYLRYMQGLDYEYIAAIMDMNSDSARKLVYRSIQTVRKNATCLSIPLLYILQPHI